VRRKALKPIAHFSPMPYLAFFFLVLPLLFAGCFGGKNGEKQRPIQKWSCDPQADRAMREKDYLNSILFHQRLLEKEPQNALALYHLGYSYGQKGDHEIEVLYYERAKAAGYIEGSFYFNMGMAYGEIGKEREAITCFKKAISLNPNLPDNYLGLGLAYSRTPGGDELAEEAFLKAISMDPGFLYARLCLGRFYAGRKKVGEAKEQLYKILEIDPENSDARDLLKELKDYRK